VFQYLSKKRFPKIDIITLPFIKNLFMSELFLFVSFYNCSVHWYFLGKLIFAARFQAEKISLEEN
jgi:hypothetical protein